jgi:phospholipid transport system substrate-binding protein
MFFTPQHTRRAFSIGSIAVAVAGVLPRAAMALSTTQASALVEQVAGEITRIINSGQSENTMIRDFERMMVRYGDMPTIAQSVLGPPARSATASQLSAFAEAFQGYMARKYGRRFREFLGGTVTVTGAQDTGRYIEVLASVTIPGDAPFEVRFRVWDRSGRPLFIDLLIEGVSLVISERSEIGSLLDRNGGSVDATTAALRNLG